MSFPMLTSKVLSNVLNQISATRGIDDTVILSSTGEVLSYNGNDEKNFVDVISAITSNMWMKLQNTGEGALNEDHLDCVLIKCSEGKVFISQIAGFLLCIRAKDFVGFGLLKKKSLLLKEFCQKPLKEVTHV